VDFLEHHDVPAYKIASFELTYHQLLAAVARTGKPVILSTGLATQDEIVEAIDVLQTNGATQIALLKCTSAYPADPADLNLSLIPRMIEDFAVPIGYSDHTVGIEAAAAAVALGACIIEKHVKDAASTGSADESFSTLPDDLARLVDGCRRAHAMRGAPDYGPTDSERPSLYFRRGIVAARDLPAGTVITEDDVAIVRPGIGAAPRDLPRIVGSTTTRAYRRGEGLVAPTEPPTSRD
jgi:N-acetylneuraminate synthase